MKISIQREDLLKPLQQVIGAVEKRQTLPALANVLIRSEGHGLSVTATDLEVELVAWVSTPADESGDVTIPARKLAEICKALPEAARIGIQTEGDKATVTSGKSRFTLSTLPAAEFPSLEEIATSRAFQMSQRALRRLIEKTGFAMANQDVRYYLNGLMLEVAPNRVRAVATDGHRLAMSQCAAEVDTDTPQQVIIPRKGVQELMRLLNDSDAPATVEFSTNHLRVSLNGVRFTSKLIDGRFPDYERVLPKGGDKEVRIHRDALRQALQRASILSNEKYRGIRLGFGKGILSIQAHNPEQEEAQDEIEIDYRGDPVEIGFNVNYLLDVLNTVEGDAVEGTLKDGNSSALLRDPADPESVFVVMPMRL